MTQRLADWLMSRLADEGIGHVFVLPGGGAMHLNDALACQPRLQAVACQHEQACGIAAEAYGRTGRPGAPTFGVAMVTTGPGATNIVTPVAGAWIDSVPMLVISGQAKRADRLRGRPLRQTGVQEVDIVPLVRPITKFAAVVEEPADIRALLEEALHHMRSGRPGPVWLDVPLDVQAAPVDAAALRPWQAPVRPAPSTVDFAALARQLRQAQRPLLLAGHGVRLSGAADALQALAHEAGLPCVFTWNALDLLPHEDPLNIGRPGVVATRAANFAVQNCDLLICVGARLDPVVTAYNRAEFGRHAQKIVVDIDAHELDDKTDLPEATRLALDAGDFLQGLRGALGPAPLAVDAWRARCLRWKLDHPLHPQGSFADAGPISHAHFVDALSEATPADTLVATGSSGLAVEFLYAGFRNKPGQRLFLTSGLGSMGYGLPAAIGACLGQGRSPMIAVESDGSLQLNVQELATLATQALPICLFVMNNGGYASIRNTQRNYFQGRYLASGPDSGLRLPDLAALARTYGLPCVTIADSHALAAALSGAMALPRPCLVDVQLVPDETLQPKCAAIPLAEGGMVSMPLEDMSPLLSLEALEAEMLTPLSPRSRQARGGPC
ncbi:thiamine pyrophosphate-binding protein [Ideonella dechloratans]|uniref:Thiamine pyrophosphate-binding protein n=1 Tax=Ideonella dechloratans TaxID=36863 RepID=A0A643FC01_IDEDE|nr:thiamine pyrophosphate-binding protein [Ideonella dechloratans]KAB0577385.1 thiamine pyrophosphate-binding protein [Ideonella dechloratans]UFU09246.1 thiamine pyrophosphate-binding protein [Ideonella dechloratans]